MDDLLAEFLAETREMLEAVGGELVAWESDPSDRARLDAIFRFVHTVKGNCGFFDFPRLERLSHAAESALAEVRAGQREADSALVDAVLAVVDRISALAEAIENGTEIAEKDDELLIAALEEGAKPAAIAKPVPEPDGEAGDPAPAEQAGIAVPRSIRLSVELLDRVMSAVSDMVLARNDLARRLREYGSNPATEGPFERFSALVDDVREGITRMRMQRIEHLFGALPRLIRDLSAEPGKQVVLDTDGGDVELDRELIEMIRDPLTHIIRNAIDHGIESPQARLAAGKSEIGRVHVSARQSGNRITLTIADDGAGIDSDRLLRKSIAAGILDEMRAAELDDSARNDLIFEPGLSTAEKVSAISGRGVGMDVVRSNIERIGGSIAVETGRGTGTRFHLGLPLTLSIIPALTVSAGGQQFAIPRSYVEEIIHTGNSAVEFSRVGDALLATIRGRRIACVQLSALLGLPPAAEPERSPLVLTNPVGDELFAFAVDRVLDHEELVIKPVAPAIMRTGIYAGTTLLDDGSPVMMLDAMGLARKAGLANDLTRRARGIEKEAKDHAADKSVPVLLFDGLDGRRRAIRMEMVDRIETVEPGFADLGGESPHVVIDDTIFLLAGLCGQVPNGERLNLLRLGDGSSQLAYAIRRIVDTAAIESQIVASNHRGEIEGTALIDGRTIELLDGHYLFATHAQHRSAGGKQSCRLSLDDPWHRNVLRPLVENAGYRVVGAESPDPVDLAFVSGSQVADASLARRIIRLHASRQDGGKDPDAIYRYDRDALLAALGIDLLKGAA